MLSESWFLARSLGPSRVVCGVAHPEGVFTPPALRAGGADDGVRAGPCGESTGNRGCLSVGWGGGSWSAPSLKAEWYTLPCN